MNKHLIFAGGGTGGHIYPAIAIAEKIKQFYPNCGITFLCSERPIDRNILSKTGFEFKPLPGVGFSKNPLQMFMFFKAVRKTARLATEYFETVENPVIVGTGGFISAGVLWAAYKRDIPIYMLNVDMTPGKANKFMARYARRIFVQFEDTSKKFGTHKDKVVVTGCPLRRNFSVTDKHKAREKLGIDPNKKMLLITGASSGAANINNALALLVDKLSSFSEQWQVVHLAGRIHQHVMKESYANSKMKFIVLDYYEDMANLLACADLLVGRAGAVSIAEYIASGVPAICMPYPYHRDDHQKKNAKELVKSGCGVIVEDYKDPQRNAQNLWPVLKELMTNENKRLEMRVNADKIARFDASHIISKVIMEDVQSDLLEG